MLIGALGLLIASLIGCPAVNPTEPVLPPVERIPHIDFPDWNEDGVDDRQQDLTPENRAELISILNYHMKHADNGWMARSVVVPDKMFLVSFLGSPTRLSLWQSWL